MTIVKHIGPVYDVVILGAGAAGIAAARTLQDQGQSNFLIVEGRDRIGGRTHTHPVYGDLGAAWSHINDPSLQAGGENASKLRDIETGLIGHARERGFTLHHDRQDSHIYYNGEAISREKLFHYAERARTEMAALIDKNGDMSVADAYAQMQQRDPFMAWVLDMEYGAASSGNDIKHTSTAASLDMLSLASGVLYKEGLGTLMQELGARALPHTTLGTRVTGIYTTHTPFSLVDVVTPEGEHQTIRARYVLSTIPPAVFNHHGDASEIAHNFPQWKTDAMAQLPSGKMNKIVLQFPHGYLQSRHITPNRHYEIFRQGLGSMFFLASPAGKDMVVALVGGQQSLDFEKQGTQAAAQHALQLLESVPELKGISGHLGSAHLTRWNQDPFARGAFSAPAVGATNAREMLRKPVEGKLFFAGEACATGGWETQVYGAMETGTEAAKQIAQALVATKERLYSRTIPLPPSTPQTASR